MQLDRTEIVIKQRTGLELFDLSMLLLKRHFLQVLATSALLGLPILALDVYAVAWMLGEDALLTAENLVAPREAIWWRHTGHLVALFVMQFQLISLPTTILLGNIIFYDEMPLKKLLQRLRPIALRTILVLGLFRLGLVNLAIVWFVNRSAAFDPSTEVWMLFVFTSVSLLLRAAWPFAPEILGLEVCKLRKGKGPELSYWQRSKGLHNPMASENLGRFILAALFSFLLTLMLISSCLLLQGLVTGDWYWNAWFDHLILPVSMWLVGLFMAVFRFLTYLDSRIRLEGWETELQMRAEAARLSRVFKPTTGAGQLATETVSA